VCDASTVSPIIDLGMHPMADTFVPAERRYEPDRIFPLLCDLCTECGQVQLRVITDPDERYSHFDYSYTSSNSAFSRAHWTRYAVDVARDVSLPRGSRVLEIGSNDGYLSEHFNALGFRAFGVDPSVAMCTLAAARGVEVRSALFTSTLASELAGVLGDRPELIVANNVFNHANDPKDFARGVQKLLAEQGTFVFELPYWLRTVTEGKFDQIYHEHVSYFTVKSARSLFHSVGMAIVHAEEVQYHGGSIRIFVRHRGPEDASVNRLVAQEESAGLFDPGTYVPFMHRLRQGRDRFMSRLLALTTAGEHLVCVGAAAKANTFLNYYKLDASFVDCITDASPSKIGKYTPGTRIPIESDRALARYDRVYAILTSWNLADTLRAAILAINPRVEFLNPYEAP
jgi:SAM-dependent methyltransferase